MLKLRGGKVLQKLKDMVNAETTETVNATEKNQSILDMLEAAEQENTDISAVLEKTENPEDIESIENMESAVKENTLVDTAVQPPVYIEPVKISDTYAEAGTAVIFSCYYPEAVSYNWETYNILTKSWEPIESVINIDELQRKASIITITVNEDVKDIMIRCTAYMADNTEQIDVASLYTIPEIKQIKTDSSYTANAGRYLCSKEIPVNVTYQNGTTDNLIGVYGLVFVEKAENREFSTNEIGNNVETITTINTEHGYSYIGTDDKELILRYRCKDRVCDTNLLVNGKDLEAPQITGVEISDFAIRNIDEPVKVNVSIHAEDNDTPYPYLEYAFLPTGSEPQESDWGKKMSFEKEITKNGIWIAYCRDQSGNVAKQEKEIIAVGQKAPEIKVRLENNDWCQSNKIIVDAKDELSVLFSFVCPETGEDSGWIERNEYSVSRNSIWKIQAKDAAGNIASEEITISNIDSQIPVIKEIREGANQNEDNN